MKMKVHYKDERGEVEVNVGPRAEVALERQYEIAASDATHNEHVYYLAWAALHFAGLEPSEFDAFLDSIEDVNPVEEEPEKGPTRRAPRRTASSS
jgi:hypothetical protein